MEAKNQFLPTFFPFQFFSLLTFFPSYFLRSKQDLSLWILLTKISYTQLDKTSLLGNLLIREQSFSHGVAKISYTQLNKLGNLCRRRNTLIDLSLNFVLSIRNKMSLSMVRWQTLTDSFRWLAIWICCNFTKYTWKRCTQHQRYSAMIQFLTQYEFMMCCRN